MCRIGVNPLKTTKVTTVEIWEARSGCSIHVYEKVMLDNVKHSNITHSEVKS